MPDWRRIVSRTVGSPSRLAFVSASAISSSTRATSRSWTGCRHARGRRCRRLLDRLHASASAECHGGGALLDATARNFGVLRLERSRHIGDSEVVGPEPIGIERHVDLPRPSTDDHYLADTADAFELPAHFLSASQARD